ncbi:unnamed protein product, partial [Cuscuta epithymum]
MRPIAYYVALKPSIHLFFFLFFNLNLTSLQRFHRRLIILFLYFCKHWPFADEKRFKPARPLRNGHVAARCGLGGSQVHVAFLDTCRRMAWCQEVADHVSLHGRAKLHPTKINYRKCPVFIQITNRSSFLLNLQGLSCHSQLQVVTVIMAFRRSGICVGYNERDEGNRKMVDCGELEAAQALAGLAHSSMLPDPSTGPGASGHASPPPPLLDLYLISGGAQDGEERGDDPQKEGLTLSSNIMGGSGKMTEILNSSSRTLFSSCDYDYSSITGCKSRRSVAEAKKEAQRLRRVVANRESARQTIRRRQAMYDELTRRAAHLVSENQNLKKEQAFKREYNKTITLTFNLREEKELAAKEYDGLKSTNDRLRAQMTKAVKEEMQGTHEVSYPVQGMSSSTSTAHSFYNHTPVVQHGSQNYSIISSVGEPTTPLLVLPLPWFIPFHSPGQYFPQSYSDHNESSSSLPGKDKTEDSISSTKHVHTEMTLHFQSGLETHHPEQADFMASSMTSTGQVKTQDSS